MKATRSDALVTVIVAAYNRPDTLAVAIESVLAQTEPRWRLLIIGDRCDSRIEQVVTQYRDDRIEYVNLAERWGEQSGPNSVGMALADTEYLAFLNHDDVFLQDHLSIALSHFEKKGQIDFYFARTAFVCPIRDSAGVWQAVPTEVGPEITRFAPAFALKANVFEPCSAWVFRRTLYERIGPWRSARSLYRTPLQDWMLRLWRSGAPCVFGDEISVIKIWRPPPAGVRDKQPKQRPPGGSYSHRSPVHDYLRSLVRDFEAPAARTRLVRDMRQDGPRRTHEFLSGPGQLRERFLYGLLVNRLGAGIYRAMGWDTFSLYARLVGRKRGATLAKLSLDRTGMELPAVPDLDTAIRQARHGLVSR
ncbi:MAG TPA: glycosyltransferase family 2 protein [Gammaproteobacteria bacterium]|nr:glycosyltransferase family 2 protein [Gammaproteobacteria bacterium]